ncbi:MAG: glycosyltransferase family 1 protein [Caldilineae bacterium]|nr:MAG: glycosyltransferase family 1 protein [Caldilineae bacterium]
MHEKARRLIANDGVQLLDSPLWQMEGLVTAVDGRLPVVARLQTSMRQLAMIQGDRSTDALLFSQMEQTFLHRAMHLVPNSRATWKQVQEIYRLPGDAPSTIIPHGIKPVPEEEVPPFAWKEAGEPLTILYVGRLEKRKGVQALFEAIPLVVQRHPNVRFVLAGEDNSLHDGFRQATGQDYPTYFREKYPDVQAQVSFLGRVSDEKLTELYGACDVFVAPSLYESFGLIYLEAMNYAKPVIGCQAGGIPEVVNHGVTGLLVEPDAHRPLAEALITLVESPQRRYEMGQAGRERLLRSFTHLQMAQGFARVYRAIIHAHQQHQAKEGAL